MIYWLQMAYSKLLISACNLANEVAQLLSGPDALRRL